MVGIWIELWCLSKGWLGHDVIVVLYCVIVEVVFDEVW